MVAQNEKLDHNGATAQSGGGSVTTPIALPNTDQSRSYNLDALGNWTSSVYTPEGGSQVSDQRNHNKLNEIIQRTVGTSPAVTFQYDGATGASNGNLKNDGTLIYAYDALNRLIQANRVSDGLIIATYVYDAMNRRVRKTISNGGLTGSVPNGTTDYIYMGNQAMEDRNPFGGSGSTDTPIRQYVWGTYIDECIQLNTLTVLGPQNLPAGAYYLLQDLLYRAVALTNSSGAIVEAYDTDAYGNTIIFTAPSEGGWWSDFDTQSYFGANEIIYCGYRFDPESELYYVRNRGYSPTLGRWLQRDPIGYAGGINLYEYVGGRAVIGIDPAGEFCCSDQCSRGACPRFLRITYRKRSCLYPGTGASGIEQGLRNFEKYFYFPGSVLKWPVEPDIMPGVPIGAITGAGGGISNRLEKNTGVYIEGTMEYETCELRPCLGVLTQWVWSQQESPKFVFPVCVPDTVPWVTWAEAWLLYVMRRGYFPILSAATCGH